jgi:hypothetical protein
MSGRDRVDPSFAVNNLSGGVNGGDEGRRHFAHEHREDRNASARHPGERHGDVKG